MATTPETRSVVDVAIDPRSGGKDAIYTYAAPAGMQPGDAAIVPLGNRKLLGYVVRCYEADEDHLGFRFDQLKTVIETVEGLQVPPILMEAAHFTADRYLCPLPSALAPVVPPGAKDRLATVWRPVLGADLTGLSPVRREVLRAIDDAGGELMELPVKPLPEGTQRHLKDLQKLGLLTSHRVLKPFREAKSKEKLYRLIADSARIEEFLLKEGRKKPAQALVLITLQEAPRTGLRSSEIRAMAAVTEATVKSLVTAGLLEVAGEDSDPTTAPPMPNVAQGLAIAALEDAVKFRQPQGFLLFGVTGSGKTEVFLRAAAEALRQGRRVLYLVPEITLAVQAISQLRRRFGASVSVLHSEMSAGERLTAWSDIRDGRTAIVLGPRSAVFAPIDDLGLIIVDEEHEQTYKQDNVPRYHAREVAKFLSERHQCPYVLGSATPSVESYYRAETEELSLLSLPRRAAEAQLPTVQICDLGEGYRAGSAQMFVPDLADALQGALDRQEQAILFLNRRAYAPFLMCRDCGHQWMCPHCSVSLSFHRGIKRLKCHQCGYQESPPESCPACSHTRIAPFGIGTEKVEEALREQFPTARVARLDRDVVQRKGALEEILSGFRARELDFLVGTQMVAKGLDFPWVTVVGVIAADVSLNLPDFRASERTFQLLSQVSGRAGRSTRPGNVFIQTFNPEHSSVVFAKEHNYVGFYDWIRSERDAAQYPPYCRLINITVAGANRPQVKAATADLAQRLTAEAVDYIGPADCVLERLQEKWRRHLMIKLPTDASLGRVKIALNGYEPAGVNVTVDVDPYSLM